MDIGNLATKDNADEGVWFQLVLYGKKQNLDVKIIGADSDVVQQFQREQIRKMKSTFKNGNASIEDIDDETFDELVDSNDENVLIRMNGLRVHNKPEEPIELNGVVLGNDRKSYALAIEKIPAMKKFVLDKSNERLGFLSAGKKN